MGAFHVGAMILAALAVGAVGPASAADQPKVTYVGMGRSICSGSTAACAQIDANNRQVDEINRRQYQEQQDRADRYVEESRRREREAQHLRQSQ